MLHNGFEQYLLTVAIGASSPVTVYGLHLDMQGSRKFQANGDEQESVLTHKF